MTFFVLASVRQAPPAPAPTIGSGRAFWLESWDGSQVIPLSESAAWSLAVGTSGLEVAPVDVITSPLPGVPGSLLRGVTTPERPVELHLQLTVPSWQRHDAELQALRDLTDPTHGMTPDGNFRLVCSGPTGTRHLALAYRAGLEGDGEESRQERRVALACVAPLPWAQDRQEQSRTFQVAPDDASFLGGTWGSLHLASSSVMGTDTPVEMLSAVPVYPTVAVTGPADSVTITGDNGLHLAVPGGVDAGSQLVIVTDPRHKSVRRDGVPAAGALSLASTAPPFSLGTTLITVTAPGATSATRLTLSWRGLHRSLW